MLQKCPNCGRIYDGDYCPNGCNSPHVSAKEVKKNIKQQKKKCPICNEKLPSIKLKTIDGMICGPCANMCDSYKTKTTLELSEFWNIKNERFKIFNNTQTLKSFNGEVNIDHTNKLLIFGSLKKIKKLNIVPLVYSFDEIDSYEYEYETEKKGGITRAVVGGAIAGTAGALVGSVTAKEKSVAKLLKIYFSTPVGKKTYFMLMPPPIGLIDFLDDCIVAKTDTSNSISQPQSSSADEIMKFKNLLDQGVITQEEFDAKKKELLGL